MATSWTGAGRTLSDRGMREGAKVSESSDRTLHASAALRLERLRYTTRSHGQGRPPGFCRGARAGAGASDQFSNRVLINWNWFSIGQRHTVTLNQPNVVGDLSAPADFQSGSQDDIGDGGTGTVEYLCSGGKISRKAFNFGSCQDANSSPQTVHCTRPGLPFADIDSAT